MSLYMLHRFCGCFVIVLGEITASPKNLNLAPWGDVWYSAMFDLHSYYAWPQHYYSNLVSLGFSQDEPTNAAKIEQTTIDSPSPLSVSLSGMMHPRVVPRAMGSTCKV